MKEWIVLILAAVMGFGVLALSIRRVVRQCVKLFTVPEPSEEAYQLANVPKQLPNGIWEIEEGLGSAQQICEQAQAILLVWMKAYSNRDVSMLSDVLDAHALQAKIDRQICRGERERFEDPKVHGAVITKYMRETQEFEITLAAQAIHYIACKGQLVAGREDLPEQMRWKMHAKYQGDKFVFDAIEQIE